VIVVSNRGPATFVRAEDGSFRARRGSGGLAGTLGRLLSGGADGPVGWVAAAMTDDDRAAAAAGATALPDISLGW
jgi:trehalose 6-phosphate synthase